MIRAIYNLVKKKKQIRKARKLGSGLYRVSSGQVQPSLRHFPIAKAKEQWRKDQQIPSQLEDGLGVAGRLLLVPHSPEFIRIAVAVGGDDISVARFRVGFLPEIELLAVEWLNVHLESDKADEDVIKLEVLGVETTVVQTKQRFTRHDVGASCHVRRPQMVWILF